MVIEDEKRELIDKLFSKEDSSLAFCIDERLKKVIQKVVLNISKPRIE
jgi:hypothetical protein